VIAVDMPGHGHSACLPRGSDLTDFVGWIGTFIEELSLGRVNLAGHSMGALISGGAVATFPERIRRVALLNGVHRRDSDAKAAVLARAEAIPVSGIDIDGPVKRWFGDDEISHRAGALTRAWLTGMDPEAYATAYGAFAGGDTIYADGWSSVRCPALFLTGADDPNSTPAMAEAMAALAPNGYARIIEGHRHMVNLTAPDEVNRLLAEWLAKPEVTT
jgi:pimeloyl-ACP methyl ester carboxylesterase